MSELPETRFTRAGDVDIAYQVAGSAAGPDLVLIPAWVSHLEVMWELPEFARFLDRLAAMGRLITFDKRGTGLSDRVAGVPTWEERADDITAVLGDLAVKVTEEEAAPVPFDPAALQAISAAVESSWGQASLAPLVASVAQASEVLVTSTVQMLVLGSGIGFADRGRHRLKGVPDQWQLFAVEHT